MHTFKGQHTLIHYDYGSRGNLHIHDQRNGKSIYPHAQDIIDFVKEQWSRKLIETLEKTHEHGQWIPDPSDARHKEIMDMLKEIRDAVRLPQIATRPAISSSAIEGPTTIGESCVCRNFQSGEMTAGWFCPVHGQQT